MGALTRSLVAPKLNIKKKCQVIKNLMNIPHMYVCICKYKLVAINLYACTC